MLVIGERSRQEYKVHGRTSLYQIYLCIYTVCRKTLSIVNGQKQQEVDIIQVHHIYINIPSPPQGQELYLFSPRQSFLFPIIVDCIYDWLFFSCNHQIVVYIYTEAKQGYTHKNRSYQEICKWRLSLGSILSSIPWCYFFASHALHNLCVKKSLQTASAIHLLDCHLIYGSSQSIRFCRRGQKLTQVSCFVLQACQHCRDSDFRSLLQGVIPS